MDNETDLDLLDLGNEADVLPEATPFSSPRPKKPWLLMTLGLVIIVLSVWIIIKQIGSDSGTRVNIDLDAPFVTEDTNGLPNADLTVPDKAKASVENTQVEKVAEIKPDTETPVETKPVETDGKPIRVVDDRKDVVFNPDKAPAPKKTIKKAPRKTSTPKTAVKTSNGGIYVQFGSYSTRALAQSAERKMRSGHVKLFDGKQFVILAANVNGHTTYRLRIAFHSVNEANGFCRNAKSDGLDCYVTK